MLELIIKEHKPKSILDLGSQQLYNQPHLPAPYARKWWERQGIEYTSIDLNGEDGALQLDLSEYIAFVPGRKEWDIVVDAGTSEHVGKEGRFNWEAIYNCWCTKFKSLRIGGVMYSENPKTKNWPLHGWNYYTSEFYHELESCSGLALSKWGEVCAMGNCIDGKNIWAWQEKQSDIFPSLFQFKELSIKQS